MVCKLRLLVYPTPPQSFWGPYLSYILVMGDVVDGVFIQWRKSNHFFFPSIHSQRRQSLSGKWWRIRSLSCKSWTPQNHKVVRLDIQKTQPRSACKDHLKPGGSRDRRPGRESPQELGCPQWRRWRPPSCHRKLHQQKKSTRNGSRYIVGPCYPELYNQVQLPLPMDIFLKSLGTQLWKNYGGPQGWLYGWY